MIRVKKAPILLRLLSTPVFRYQSKPKSQDQSVVDGAIFCFVQGTDPEILLMVEAVQREDALHWEFSVGRMSRFQLEIRHRGEVVKELPWARRDSDPSYRVVK